MESTEHEPADKVIYLLGFAPVSAEGSIEVDGLEYSISNMVHGRIRSWYIPFDAAEFQGADAAANLEDLQWLTPRVLAHQHAIDHLCGLGPLYPARFATLFSSLDSLRQSVSAWQSDLESFFARVEGKQEWACKIHLLNEASSAPSQTDQDKASSTNGRNYLLARRQASEAKKRQGELVVQVVDDLEQALIDAAADIVRRPNVQLDQSEDAAVLIGNLALLIGEDQVQAIETLTAGFTPPELLQRKVSIELSGPFAPYSFCTNLPPVDNTAD